MSTTLHVIALVVAVLSVPSIGGLTAWGLAGGDGSPKNPVVGLLGALVGLGSIYNAVVTWRAFWGLPEWAWWLMWVPPVAGLLGLLLTRDEATESTAGDWAVGLSMQLGLAVPAALLWVAGVPG